MSSQTLVDAVRQSLREGESLLEHLSDKEYRTPCPQVFHGTIGSHYRHVLDHFRNLIEVSPNGALDYDRRVRETPVEIRRSAALAETQRLAGLMAMLDAEWSSRRLQISTRVSTVCDGIVPVDSTAGREAVFCILHAVHHYALIRVICGFLGKELPSDFGVAPSTLAADAVGSS